MYLHRPVPAALELVGDWDNVYGIPLRGQPGANCLQMTGWLGTKFQQGKDPYFACHAAERADKAQGTVTKAFMSIRHTSGESASWYWTTPGSGKSSDWIERNRPPEVKVLLRLGCVRVHSLPR